MSSIVRFLTVMGVWACGSQCGPDPIIQMNVDVKGGGGMTGGWMVN